MKDPPRINGLKQTTAYPSRSGLFSKEQENCRPSGTGTSPTPRVSNRQGYFQENHQMTLFLRLAQAHPSKCCEDKRLICVSFPLRDSKLNIAHIQFPHRLTEIQNKELTTLYLPSDHQSRLTGRALLYLAMAEDFTRCFLSETVLIT